ncbi:hypothetical protein JO41_08290 [Treponema sp. OMZ 838]|uniref:hypothetical protein n=1 Tax=Treponema sp. OMZ 838 TaxID=1539298 RepID=UPI0005300CB6|nr:hypothetical protein [Treponema sp. OMZ 838]AIW89787.1 hypothetical protein JO41_08290 [Treponema sp. OMZ 838]
MIKTETRMMPIEEQIYYCDSCGDKIGSSADLKIKRCQELKTTYRYRDFLGDTWGERDISYYLCCCCFDALQKHLVKKPNSKKGLKDILK